MYQQERKDFPFAEQAPMAWAKTRYDLGKVTQAYRLLYQQRTWAILAIAVAITAFYLPIMILNPLMDLSAGEAVDLSFAYRLILPLLLVWVIVAVWQIKLSRAAKMGLRSNHTVAITIFPDHIHLDSHSDFSAQVWDWRYSDIRKVCSDGEQVVLYGPGAFAMFLLYDLEGNSSQALELLKGKVKRFSGPTWLTQGRPKGKMLMGKSFSRLRTALLVLFVLSCCAVLVGLILSSYLSASLNAKGFECFYYGFCLVLPIPLAAFLLGEWGQTRGLPTKKERIAGAVVTAVLLLLALFFFAVS